jgi:hypothetical protein
MNQEKDIGLVELDDCIASMHIDEKWSVRQPRSVKWWGYDLAQTIWVDYPIEEPDISVAKIHAKTDIWKNVSSNPEVETVVNMLNTTASLNCLVYEKEKSTISLYCSAYIHKENKSFIGPMFKLAAAIQTADALIKASFAAELMNEIQMVRNSTGHPTNGMRDHYDELTEIIRDFVRPQGEKESPYCEMDFAALKNIDPNPSIMTNADNNGITAEFPVMDYGPSSINAIMDDYTYSSGSALFQATNKENHPQLGSGCFIKIILPIGENESEVVNSLNLLEMSGNNQTHFLGSWCQGPEGITYVSFLPTAIYRPRLLNGIFHSYSVKAQWATKFLQNNNGE